MMKCLMVFPRILGVICAVLFLVTHTGCGGRSSGAAQPAVVADPERPKLVNISPDIISTGNNLTILFADIPNPFVHEVKVRQDGEITLPVVSANFKVAGKTAGQVQDELHKLFVPSYFKRLTITVRTDARFFTVSGQVRLAGMLPYITDTTILRAIATAGDFTDFADRRSVELTRASGEKFVVDCVRAQQDPNLDLPVYPGDQINVKRRLF